MHLGILIMKPIHFLKKYSLFILGCALLFTLPAKTHALTFLKTNSGDLRWSANYNWRVIGDTEPYEAPETPPNDNSCRVENEYNAVSVLVDGEYTVGKMSSNSDTGYADQTGTFTWDLNYSDGVSITHGTINIDVANYSGYGISMWFGGNSQPFLYSQGIVYSGGVINYTNSSDPDAIVWVQVAGRSQNAEDAKIHHTKSITFDAQNTLNISNYVYFKYDTEAGEYNTGILNMFGTVNVLKEENDSISYKDVLIGAYSATDYQNTIFNIGDPLRSAAENTTAIFTCGSFKQEAATAVNINGVLNVYGSYQTIANSTGKAGRTSLYVAEGAQLNIKSGDTSVRNPFNISGTDAVIAGTVNIDHGTVKGEIISSVDYIGEGSVLTIKNGGSITQTSSTGLALEFVVGGNATLIVEKGGYLYSKNQVRFGGDNSRIVLYQENALTSAEGVWKVISYSAANKDVYLELHANQDLLYFSWWGTSETDTRTFHVDIGDEVTLISMEYLTESNGSEGLNTDYRFISFTNFRNNIIKVDDVNSYELDRLYQISAEGYEDFRFDFVNGVDGTDGYWLNATQIIPEPSTYAILISFFALSFALKRRNRR